MVMLNVGKSDELAATGMNPESNPGVDEVAPSSLQGSAKEDSVIVWFFDTNWKTTTSLTAA